MPDTLTRCPNCGFVAMGSESESYFDNPPPSEISVVAKQRDEALARLDALTAAVERMRLNPEAGRSYLYGTAINDVLAILRGERADPDAEAEAEFLKPIKPQGL